MAPNLPCLVCFDLKPSNIHKFSKDDSSNDAADDFVVIHVPLKDCYEKAKVGCTICSVLYNTTTHFEPLIQTQDPDKVLLKLVGDIKRPLTFRITHGTATTANVELYTYEHEAPSPWPFIGMARQIPTEPLSTDSQQQIHSWIEDCLSNHPHCRIQDASFQPKRLLNVGSNSNDQVYVVETESSTIVPYIALSHRWPKKQLVPTTTTKNLDSRKQGIPYTDLTLTFQEAVIVTRWLGLNYLWIDSLCILQDSSTDWEEQAALMAEVYENSWITLAARPAAEGESCLPQPLEVFTQHMEQASSSPSCHIHARRHCHHGFLYPFDGRGNAHDEVDDVSARAWCFQERVIATRILHLTPYEYVFECNSSISCECREVCDHGVTDQNYRLKGKWAARNVPEDDTDLFRVTWKSMVEFYSAKSITYESDRLPAISAVAKRMQTAVSKPLHYLAGLWEEDLPYCLSWEMSTATAVRQDGYTAPSFSWASMRGSVRMPQPQGWGERQFRVELIEASCPPKGKNPFGEVQSGYIRLRGFLYSTRLSLADGRGGPGTTICCTLLDSFFNLSLDTADDKRLLEEDKEKAFYLFEISSTSNISNALVLVDGLNALEYKRIGIVEFIRSHIFESLEPAAITIV